MRNIMRGWGASEGFMNSLLETFWAIDSGKLENAEMRNSDSTTATTLMSYARSTIAPFVRQPVAELV